VNAPDEPVADDVVGLLDRGTRTCQLLAEQDEAPYRRGEQPRRRDITEGSTGFPLRLGLPLRTEGGERAEGVDVELWHCDARGRSSGYPPNDAAVAVDPSPQPPGHAAPESSS
jgi:protocatechuate 3,4-dioxygenase beta subunit